MKSRRAQIQMMETIAILLIFFVIIVIGFIFFIRMASYGQGEKITKAQELESIRVSQAISFLPELQCSSKNIIKDNCFDKYKLNAFAGSTNDEIYYPLFYYSNITVEETYPNNNTWVLYERVRNGTYYTTFIPILLYNATDRTYSFGSLNVKYYTIG